MSTSNPAAASPFSVELLTQLANEFFAAAPGAVEAAAARAPQTAPQTAPQALPRSAPQFAPQIVPHTAPDGVPPAPTFGGTAGSAGGSAATPTLGALPAAPPGELPQADPTAFGLPSAEELRALLAPVIRSPQAPAAPASSSGYYFLGESFPRGSLVPQVEKLPPAIAPAVAPHAVGDLGLARAPFDIAAVRRDFPILAETVNGKPLVWLDNAATTHKPQAVIDRLAWFYAHENSNIHRAAHELAARATDAYEAARDKVRGFLGAASSEEIVFVRGATEGINLIAKSWGKQHIGAGDEIIVTHLEHHANIVPWQQLCAEVGATLRVAPVDDSGQIRLDAFEALLTPRTRLVSLTQVSNALGTVTPAREMVAIAHRHGARVLVDGAQAVSHLPIDVRALDCDWYVFSGHKVFAPTGIGAVYGKREVLKDTVPWQGGGNMIADVTFEKTLYQPSPARFEAGTGNIADAVGLGAAIDYVQRLGMENIARYEHELLLYGTRALCGVPGLRLIGTAADKASVLSFVLDGYTTEEVGKALNREGIAVRSGHHCAQPILRRFGVEATVRPSLAFYNTRAEIDALVAVLLDLKR